jgi:hypothetical protein
MVAGGVAGPKFLWWQQRLEACPLFVGQFTSAHAIEYTKASTQPHNTCPRGDGSPRTARSCGPG